MIPLVALSFLLQLLLEDTDSTLRVAIPCTSDSQSLVLHLLFYFSLTSSRQESLVHALVLVLRKLFGELSPKRVLLLSSSFSRSCLLVSLLSPVPVLLLLLLLFRDKKSDWQKEEVRRVLQVHLNMLQKDWLKGRPCKDCLKSGWSAIRFAVKYTCPLSMSAYLTVSFSCLPWILPCNSWQFQLFSDAYSSSLAAFSSVNAFSSSFESDSLIANREVSSFFFSNIQFFILILVCERDSYISFLIIKAILHSWFSHSSNLSFKYRETDSSAKNFLLLQSRESSCPRVSLRTSFYYCPGDLERGSLSSLAKSVSPTTTRLDKRQDDHSVSLQLFTLVLYSTRRWQSTRVDLTQFHDLDLFTSRFNIERRQPWKWVPFWRTALPTDLSLIPSFLRLKFILKETTFLTTMPVTMRLQ